MTIESTHVRGDATPRSIATAWGWWAVQLFVAILGVVEMFFSRFDTDSCAGRACDYVAYTAAHALFNVGVVVLLLAVAVAILLLRNHPRIAVWCAVVGIILTITLLIVSIALSRAALDLPTLEMWAPTERGPAGPSLRSGDPARILCCAAEAGLLDPAFNGGPEMQKTPGNPGVSVCAILGSNQ